MIRATCTDCHWTAEADDRTDANRASMFHFDVMHAQAWCRFCQVDTGGPMEAHPACVDYAAMSFA